MSRWLLFGAAILGVGTLLLILAAIDAIKGQQSQATQWLAWMGLSFALAGGLLILYGWRDLERTRRLTQEGTASTGTVTAIKKSRIQGFSDVPLYVLHYRYQDHLGQTHSDRSYLTQLKAFTWQVGDTGAVRFDREQPRRSVWVGKELRSHADAGLRASTEVGLPERSPRTAATPKPSVFDLVQRSPALRSGARIATMMLLVSCLLLFMAYLSGSLEQLFHPNGSWPKMTSLLLVFGFFVCLSAWRMRTGIREVQAWLRLSRQGLATEGTIGLVEETVETWGRWGSGSTLKMSHWVIEYRYRDNVSEIHSATNWLSAKEAAVLRVGDKGVVRFDREHPQDSLWVGKA